MFQQTQTFDKLVLVALRIFLSKKYCWTSWGKKSIQQQFVWNGLNRETKPLAWAANRQRYTVHRSADTVSLCSDL